jgi:hypothetical protein
LKIDVALSVASSLACTTGPIVSGKLSSRGGMLVQVVCGAGSSRDKVQVQVVTKFRFKVLAWCRLKSCAVQVHVVCGAGSSHEWWRFKSWHGAWFKSWHGACSSPCGPVDKRSGRSDCN